MLTLFSDKNYTDGDKQFMQFKINKIVEEQTIKCFNNGNDCRTCDCRSACRDLVRLNNYINERWK